MDRKNAENIAALVDVDRQVSRDFLGTAPWDPRPLIEVLVGQVVERLGAPGGIEVFCPPGVDSIYRQVQRQLLRNESP